ncbi:MAG: UDP-N-acetylmuramate:L-alanyl-gamma-D-glutamyl-meso-diaminopimelate ligase, partial [Marinobacter sp.]|nr:UDP-N-acetylmuramate:L-alanyl-gamma-D-glutamyl-meso-diaminopimelate ligase [Marinobacter sp.]
LRNQVGDETILALIEPRSNTMQQGIHRAGLLDSARVADKVFWANLSQLDWLDELVVEDQKSGEPSSRHQVESSVEALIARTLEEVTQPCHIVIMSNGGFGGIHGKLVTALERQLQA